MTILSPDGMREHAAWLRHQVKNLLAQDSAELRRNGWRNCSSLAARVQERRLEFE
jgi:hypothetical protein